MTASTGDPIALGDWQPTVSGNATLDLSHDGRSLRMDFDFKGGKGFVVARRAWPQAMPQEFALHLCLRGRGPVNGLEIKLLDPTGTNVWRHAAPAQQPSPRWRRWRLESCDIPFGWGPASGSVLTQLGFIEIAVVAQEGGRGSWWIAGLRIEDLTAQRSPAVEASSAQAGFEAAHALGGSGWSPQPGDRRPWITIDFERARRIGGLIIDWLGRAPATGFRIRSSSGGRRWSTVRQAVRAGGTRSFVYLPALKARRLRLELAEPSDGCILELQPFEFSRSIEAFWYAVAAAAPRGWYPRWLCREQSTWTPLGRADGTQCALLNQDGMLEPAQGSCSLEPMLLVAGRLFTWADVSAQSSLRGGWMPIPSVAWRTAEWCLTITAEALEDGRVRSTYALENLTGAPLQARLLVVVRPFQVTPPWQSFRRVGGVSRIHRLGSEDATVRVDAALDIHAAGAGFGALAFDEGPIAAALAAGAQLQAAQAHDEFGFATGVLDWDCAPAPGSTAERVILSGACGVAAAPACAAVDWQACLRTDQWSGADWAAEALDAVLTSTAHILVTRSGPALQPGPRRYTRSWIRDGAMMAAALLRMGHAPEVREFIRWYAPHQRADGFVPCCVDRDGIDWLVEHDSHGQLIAVVADYFRFTADAATVRELWPHIEAAAECIGGLLEDDGLLPISVSHEGYLAQPVHSFWDDFWGLRGLQDALYLAQTLGQNRQRWERQRSRLETGLFAAIEAIRAARKLDFIPASVEWADFDPTATANAMYLLDVPEGLDRAALERTFDAYLADWRAKRSGRLPWQSYTPYEIRIIGALVRLGRRDEALELLRFFLADRRPASWNQWPEIAWRDRGAPAHLGDLPHTWICAEYVLAVRSLFAYERAGELVLAGGLAPQWIEGDGVRVRAMPTACGTLSYTLRRLDARTVRFDIGAIDCRLRLRPPLAAPLRAVRIDGEASAAEGSEVTLARGPAEVICTAF